MIIGYLGGVTFYASSRSIKTLNDIQKNRTAKFATHSIINKKPKLEFQGVELSAISFSVRLDASLGVSPEQEIESLNYILDNGMVCDLIIGSNYHGEYVIKDIGESVKRTDREGNTIVAELSISLMEYN